MSDLISAAKTGDIANLQNFILRGADVNRKDAGGRTPLHCAAEYGHVEIVNTLLAKGANVHAKDKDGYTPLHWAAMYGHVEVVNTLLAKGADVNAKDKYWQTAMDIATSNKHVKVVECLKNAMQSIHRRIDALNTAALESVLTNNSTGMEKIENGNTPLLHAAARGFYEGVEILLRYKANILATQEHTLYTVLHLAVLKGDIPMMQLVLECGQESLINKQDKDGNTALHVAIGLGREDSVQTLLFFYPDMTVRNHQGESVLECAVKFHAWNIFVMLCQHEGTQWNDVSSHREEESWLVMAYRDRHVEALKWLLEYGGGGDWQDIDTQSGLSILHMVCQELCDHDDLVSTCFSPAALVSSSSTESLDPTVLHLQVFFQRFQQAPWLLLHYGAEHGKKEVLETVLEACSSADASLINRQDETKDGNTAMHLAMKGGHVGCVRSLLFFYPDMTVRNHQGESALEYAVKLHVWDIFVMLCQHEGTQWNDVSSHREEESWLAMAYRDRHVGALKWLLEHGGGGDWQDIDTQSGLSILHMVCQELCDHDDLVSTCFSPAALVSSSSTESSDPTVLHLQVFFQRFQQAPWLLLHYGAEHGKKEVLETVLEACSSADASLINRQDETKDGNTAMHLAVKGGHVGCVRSLLYFYPDLTVVNKDGETALYTAAKHHHWEAVCVLLQHDDGGSSLELHAHHPKTAGAGADSLLKLAAQDKQAEVVRMLVEKAGADVKEMDSKSGLRVLLNLLEEVIPAKEEEVVVQICDWLCSLVEANPMLSYEFKQLDGRRVLGGTIIAYHNNDRICVLLAKIFSFVTLA